MKALNGRTSRTGKRMLAVPTEEQSTKLLVALVRPKHLLLSIVDPRFDGGLSIVAPMFLMEMLVGGCKL